MDWIDGRGNGLDYIGVKRIISKYGGLEEARVRSRGQEKVLINLYVTED
ncbi:MAG: hypothetical protein IJH63_00855 [Methanobrevibacter sp.]|nr:hypothetical protein [Methanosphaera sp.]MBR0369254.1 hypothetical protein [Methanobrevibacter sp.]